MNKLILIISITLFNLLLSAQEEQQNATKKSIARKIRQQIKPHYQDLHDGF
jgi:hypothetical protein